MKTFKTFLSEDIDLKQQALDAIALSKAMQIYRADKKKWGGWIAMDRHLKTAAPKSIISGYATVVGVTHPSTTITEIAVTGPNTPASNPDRYQFSSVSR